MNLCNKYRQWMWLKMYDELDDNQKHELNDHLKMCDNCSAHYGEIVQTHQLLNKKIQAKPTESFLQQNRNELHQRLLLARQVKLKPAHYSYLRKILSLDFSPAIRWATVFTVLLLGIFLGNRFFSEKAIADLSPQQQLLSNIDKAAVESINYDPATKRVMVTVNALQRLTIEGEMEAPEIKHLLTQTLVADQRPNMRLKTVGLLALTKSYDKQIVEALIEVLEKDENPGIRLKAIRLLTEMPVNHSVRHIIINVLIQVLLKERNSAIRNEAIDGLNKLKNGIITPVIVNAAKNDTSEYVQAKAAILLQRTKNPEIPENE